MIDFEFVSKGGLLVHHKPYWLMLIRYIQNNFRLLGTVVLPFTWQCLCVCVFLKGGCHMIIYNAQQSLFDNYIALFSKGCCRYFVLCSTLSVSKSTILSFLLCSCTRVRCCVCTVEMLVYKRLKC